MVYATIRIACCPGSLFGVKDRLHKHHDGRQPRLDLSSPQDLSALCQAVLCFGTSFCFLARRRVCDTSQVAYLQLSSAASLNRLVATTGSTTLGPASPG